MQCPIDPAVHDASERPGRTVISPLYLLKQWFRRATGNPAETDLREYWRIIEQVKAVDFSNQTDRQLTESFSHLVQSVRANSGKQRASPSFPEELEIETFALVREAARRAVHLDPFDVQMLAGLVMARARLAELPTGEGKTLAAVFPACLNALAGRGVHILTFNDYLARRDAAWMGPVYNLLGLSVGCVQEGIGPARKQAAYSCDITYATAKEAGFDFLRDRIVYDRHELVHRPFHFALVDEADSILIDEARIPLVISGAEDRASWDSHRLARLVKRLVPGRDFETDNEHRNIFLTDAGIERVESLLECGSLYTGGNQPLLEAVYCALHAESLLRRDVDYIVRGGRIEIVDEFTGRVVEERHWPDGLQAAVEAKEGTARKTEGRILGSITLQHFFRLYPTIAGMTATAESGAHELEEFYGLKVVIVPPHTPSIRVDHPDIVFTHKEAKRRALVREICDVHATGRPVLVGTANIRESEELAADLRTAGLECEVLNARNDELEAGIIAKAGMPGAVTISTNMAGRGTDIKLGGIDERERAAVIALGGLYVIGTNRHESARIDRQLRGRAGRQGDPGSTRFFISLRDDLFERYGLTRMFLMRHKPGDEAQELSGAIHFDIAHAQRIVEGQNFDIRRMLYKYSSLIEIQRQVVQDGREQILAADSAGECSVSSGSDPQPARPASILAELKPTLFEEGVNRFGRDRMAEFERRAVLFHIDRMWSDHLAWIQDTRDGIHFVSLGGQKPINEFQKWATTEFLDMQDRVDDAVVTEMEALIEGRVSAESALERLKAPSSTWTYLVNEDQFGWGIDKLKEKNIGYAFTGPLYALALILDRRLRSRKK